ncbi:MAG: hypothetical protein CSA22_01130 [Deltaproteobacteria bacterium]|nr:MAG: hypothetical protein CSA22_01130 [Deltaproteobacteria bacterium]
MFTKGYGGRELHKSFQVESNDPDTPTSALKVGGRVETFATIAPKRVRLNGVLGEKVTTTVRISPRKEYPFTIKNIKALKGGNFTWTLDETDEKGQPVYTLSLEATGKKTGRFFDTLLIATDSSVKKELQLRVFGNIYEAAAQ